MGRPERGRATLVVALAVLAWGSPAVAADPTLTATGQALRARSEEWVAPLRLVDTTWWVTVEGRSGGAPLAEIEYQARFTDPEGQDQRAAVGTLELGSNDRERVSGRIDVVVPTRADYLRPFRVRLRLRDVSNAASEWVDVTFPIRTAIAPVGETPVAAMNVPAGQEPERESLGQVEAEVGNDASMADVRRALLVQARIRGATDIENLRMVSSSGDRNKFSADAVRVVHKASQPTPAARPAPETTPVREHVLGEISVRHGRR